MSWVSEDEDDHDDDDDEDDVLYVKCRTEPRRHGDQNSASGIFEGLCGLLGRLREESMVEWS